MKVKVYFIYVINGSKSDPYHVGEIINEKDVEKFRMELCKKYNRDIVLSYGYNLKSNMEPPNLRPLSELKPKEKEFVIQMI